MSEAAESLGFTTKIAGVSNQDFFCRPLSKKCAWRGAGAVCTGAEHGNEVAYLGPGQMRLVRQSVQRSAQATDNVSNFSRF